MKILHIIPSLQTGGAERLALDICIELDRRIDIEVKLFMLHDINDFEEFSFIKYIPGSIALSLRSKNVFAVSGLEKEIQEFAPNVIHTHLFEAEIVSRSIPYPQAKWFTHFHDNMPQFLTFSIKTLFNKRLLTNFYEKTFLFKRYKENKGTTFISISKDTEKYLRKNVCKGFPTFLLYNAINLETFSNEKILEERKDLKLINIGSFQAKKNQQFLVDIVKELKEKGVEVKLDLFGEGEHFEKVKAKAKANNLSKNIFFHGNVKNVEDYIKQSDIYVHSAYYEPFGLVLIEAMAGGLPVITLDGKGNRDLIIQGKNGYMISEQNTKLFTQRILEIWYNRKLYSEMSTYARQFSKQYDIREYVETLISLYSDKTLLTNF